MNSYLDKYLKYKNKYLKLKLQHAGSNKSYSNDQIEQISAIWLDKQMSTLLFTKKDQLVHENNKYYMLCNNEKYEFNWKKYKECSDNSTKSIIFNIRENIVNGLINLIFTLHNECDKSECKFNASGSIGPEATLDSDYDLTINGHYKISEIIKIFNSIFEKEFQSTSSEIFDTNLYGYSFILPKSNVINNTNIWTPLLPNLSQHGISIEELKSKNQDIWSLLRLLSLNEVKFIIIRNEIVNSYFKINNINIMKPKEKQENYIKYMNIFENLMITYNNDFTNKNKDLNTYKNEIINSLSEMNYYGDETYFTQGAFLHVVGLMYLKNNSDKYNILKQYHLIHSMIENMAYFIQSIKKGIIYSIKYFSRFLEACHIYNSLYDTKNKYYQTIKELTELSQNIKSHIRNRTDEEIMDNAKKYFGIKSIISSEEIKNNIIQQLNELLKKINNNFNNTNYIIILLDLLMMYVNENNTYIKISKENENYIFSTN